MHRTIRRDNALLKINRATEHIAELSEMLRKGQPFGYVVETNVVTGDRLTRAKENPAAIDRFAAICGDAAHNLRSALDHAYWEIVGPFAKTPREERAIQFPFSETADRLHEAISNRLAKRVSERFFKALVDLAPHHEAGGNHVLCMVDRLDIPDKHRFATPIADYSTIDTDMLRRQVPDFPQWFQGTMTIAASYAHVGWKSYGPFGDLGEQIPPTTFRFEKKLDVPVSVALPIGLGDEPIPTVPALHAMTDAVRETVNIMREAAR